MPAAWLAGGDVPGEVVTPLGWEPRPEGLIFVPNEEFDRMKFLGRNGATDRYFDRGTGAETYIGSPFRDGRIPFADLASAPLSWDAR